jgi:hypothetical protein
MLRDRLPPVLAVAMLVVSSQLARSQELPSRQSIGINGTFASTSSHILIGLATERRTWTAGFEYGVTLWGNHAVRVDYEASVSPFFLERDPRFTSVYAIVDGVKIPMPYTPGRVTEPVSGASGEELVDGSLVPVYATYGTEESYAASVSPVGFRVNGFNSHRLQPTFSLDLGVVLSGRALPIDGASRFNYLFSFGPGFEFFYRNDHAVRIEYLYRHMSNANSAQENPGIDQGVIRLTLIRRH